MLHDRVVAGTAARAAAIVLHELALMYAPYLRSRSFIPQRLGTWPARYVAICRPDPLTKAIVCLLQNPHSSTTAARNLSFLNSIHIHPECKQALCIINQGDQDPHLEHKLLHKYRECYAK